MPIRIPISSPSKSTSRLPSVVLYSDVISTSPKIHGRKYITKEYLCSVFYFFNLFRICKDLNRLYRFSRLFSDLFLFWLSEFSRLFFFCSPFLYRFWLSWFLRNSFRLFDFFLYRFYSFRFLFLPEPGASSLKESSFTVSTISFISSSSETDSILRTLITAGLLPIPKNPLLPSLIT